jgi:hypothetical protein
LLLGRGRSDAWLRTKGHYQEEGQTGHEWRQPRHGWLASPKVGFWAGTLLGGLDRAIGAGGGGPHMAATDRGRRTPGWPFRASRVGRGSLSRAKVHGAGRGLAGVWLSGYRGRFRPARLDRPLTDPLT